MRVGRIFKAGLIYLVITGVTLGICDLALIALGLFPPKYNYGDSELGWSEEASGQMKKYGCLEPATRKQLSFYRNEDGIRTDHAVAELKADTTSIRVAVIGDSQTDLCSTNDETHAGVLETLLGAKGRRAVVLAYGVGRYSPLQDYLAFRKVLRPYHPGVLVMNLYTGNDFLDILRADDRPHFVPTDTGYRIAAPEWLLYQDPNEHARSRVLFALRSFGDKTGVRGTFLRVKQLRQLAGEQGRGVGEVFGYLSDLRKSTERSLDYPDAFTAQWLNQELFFRHFPGGRQESLRRIGFLMDLIRRENPGMLLVMSPLPSYQLTGETPVDESLRRTLARLGITLEEGVAQEHELYEELRGLASQRGWLFVDNLTALKGYHGPERLFNASDYHLLPPASALVGQAQAAALLDYLARVSAPSGKPPAARLSQTRDTSGH